MARLSPPAPSLPEAGIEAAVAVPVAATVALASCRQTESRRRHRAVRHTSAAKVLEKPEYDSLPDRPREQRYRYHRLAAQPPRRPPRFERRQRANHDAVHVCVEMW